MTYFEKTDAEISISFEKSPMSDYAVLVRVPEFYSYIKPQFGSNVPLVREWPKIYQDQEDRRWKSGRVEMPSVRFRLRDRKRYFRENLKEAEVSNFDGRHRVRYAHEVLGLNIMPISFFLMENMSHIFEMNGSLFDERGIYRETTSVPLNKREDIFQDQLTKSTFFLGRIDENIHADP